MHNYNITHTYHINFKSFSALGPEILTGQILSARRLPDALPPHPPVRHAHDNTPCSQRLRGKNWNITELIQ